MNLHTLFFITFSTALSAGPLIRLITLEMVDMRYKCVSAYPITRTAVITGIFIATLFAALAWRIIRCGNKTLSLKKLSIITLPLAGMFPYTFTTPGFAGLLLIIFSGALYWGLVIHHGKIEIDTGKINIFWLIGAVSLAFAAGGWYMQCYSLDKMAMQWLDWGHFYEAVANTLDGRFFYLNLGESCYLYSRFCISLLVLIPVVMLRNVELFLLAGALSIASGGIITALAARRRRFSGLSCFFISLWFLCLPLTVNMLLPLLDGFHEVFLMIPAVFGAWYFYRRGRIVPAALLVLFTLGLRESIGFMWAGYGVVLLLEKRRRDGIILFSVSIFALFFLLGFLMPYLRGGGNYEHTVFFPHLGNSIREIVLSPFQKPAIFWGMLFQKNNWIFWGSLFLPFIWTIWKRPVLLLPLLPDLVMISLDYRFDSQNILRHYQFVPYMVLTIAALEGLFAIRRDRKTRKYCNGLLGAMLASSLFSCWCFTQIPGFPASDRRLSEWSYAGDMLERFFEKLPPEVKVTASPRIASHLVNRNDVFIYRGNEDTIEPLQDFVFIESFNPDPESILRRKLLQRPGWKLIHQEYLDERLIQLYQRAPGTPSILSTHRPTAVSPEKFSAQGMPVPSSLPQVEMRGTIIPAGYLAISARLKEKVGHDIGFAVEITSANGSKSRYFQSFGNGIIPADMAVTGEVFSFLIKLDSPVKSCKVDLLVLK